MSETEHEKNPEPNTPSSQIELAEQPSKLNDETEISNRSGDFKEVPIEHDEEFKQIVPRNLKDKIKMFCFRNILNKEDLIILGFNILSFVLYLVALSPCENVLECYGLGLKFFYLVAFLAFLSCLIVTLLLFLCFYTGKHYLHFAYVIPIFLFFFNHFNGTDNIDHGKYNFIGFTLFFIGLMSLFGTISLFRCLVIRKMFKTMAIIIICIIIFIILYNTNQILNLDCEGWNAGLNNTKINEKDRDYPCHIMQPGKNKCYMNALNGVFDFSRISGYTCTMDKLRNGERDLFIELLDPKQKTKYHFGFPITTRQKFYPTNSATLEEFQDSIYKNIIDMEKFNEQNYPNEPKPEVELIFNKTSNRGKINMHLIRNETLSAERKQRAKSTTSLYENVLILYLDAISRPNFYRKLNKTVEFLNQFTRYDTNPETKNFTVFQFFKYNTIKSHTLPNIKPMFYGIQYTDPNGTNLVKYYKEQGFVTGHTGTTCGREIFGVKLNEDGDYVRYLDYDSWDHENIAMFCDFNFFSCKFPIERGINSYFRRCLYGQPAFTYAMEYTKQFWEAYPDNKKFFRIHINEGHDGSNELLRYLNDPLYEFIKMFYDNGWLNNTFIMLMSDHGTHLPGPFTIINSQDYKIEKTLGTLFLMMPNNAMLYKNGMYDEIWQNQQTYVTPYDIHDTLIHLGVGENEKYAFAYSKKGQSLLKYIDYNERYCENKKLKYEFEEGNCRCVLNKEKKYLNY